MSRHRPSFTLSWPFIIACIIGYNLFFGDDEPKKDVDVKVSDKPAIEQKANKIDSTVDKITNEIKTSKAIQQAKEELLNAKDQLVKEFKGAKEEFKKEASNAKDQIKKEVVGDGEKETPPPEKPVEKKEPIMQADENPVIEPPSDDKPNSLDSMESL